MGIDVIAYTVESHGIKAAPVTYETAKANYRKNEINCPDLEKAVEMMDDLAKVKAEGDSCGGVIEMIAKGVPAGLGEPVFDKLSALIAHAMLSIGSIKGIEFGDGFEHARLTGSQSNDTPYFDEETGRLRFRTNKAGGLLGGISNGEEIRVRVAAKPIPTILKRQDTADLAKGENVDHVFASRSDPSALTRLYPVCEAMIGWSLLMRSLCIRDTAASTPLSILTGGIIEKMAGSSGNLILIGMPGSGKSTVGPLLAGKTGKGFVDTDDIVKAADGRELRDIVRDEGYERFLELQQTIIMSQRFSNCVISTGGGVVKSSGLMKYMKETGTVIFLDEDPDVLESRLAPGRRLVREEGQTFRDVYQERRPLYLEYSDVVIKCTGKTVEDIVREIMFND
jgi:shikimate kinase